MVQVTAAIQQLAASDQLMSMRAICRDTGLHVPSLYRYPRVISLIRVVVEERRPRRLTRRFQQREEALVLEVLHAIEQLESLNGPVTASAIAALVQLTHTALVRYPRVRIILDGVVKQRSQKLSNSH